MKKVLAVFLSMLLLLASLGTTAAQSDSPNSGDVAFARTVTQTIADMGDNPDIGNRSSGSAAEKQAADYIQKTMNDIGLQNVTMDAFTADTWSFNRGRIYYTDGSGAEQFLLLGGFATHLALDRQDVSVVYAGRGTAADYEGLDVKGKAVLIDIDQASDWWVSVPAYEAYTHGALCVLVNNVSGYAYYDGDTIGSQDICGPYDAPALSLSQNSAAILRELTAAQGGEAVIQLDVESIVTLNGVSQNVWGEIPGKTDEVIYFMAHYDGYYHSFFDDASGVGSMLAIAKSMVESGYTPDKTIRFIAHGAEEWGDSDTEYDWAIGAFKQITQVHPEWAEKAFAVLNLDGMYPVQGHTAFNVAATYELAAFAQAHSAAPYTDGKYSLTVKTPPGCWTEDFSYVMAGIPSIVASHSAPREIYHGPAYHSSMDNVVLGVDEDAWQRQLELFTGYAYALDRLTSRPLDLSERFKALEEAYEGEAALGLDGLYAAADALNQKIAERNDAYAAALETGDSEKAADLRKQGIALNGQLHQIFLAAVKATTALDWEDNVVFPFEVTKGNIDALLQSIVCLQDGDAQTALDEYLYGVDFNWYAYDFSQTAYDYLLDKMYGKAQGTWGEGMVRFPGENLWEVIHTIMDQSETEQPDYTAQIAALQESLDRQHGYAAVLDAQLTADIAAITDMIQKTLQTLQ